MGTYFFTHKAIEDLAEIYEYTYEFWSEKQADKYYAELIYCCQMLSENLSVGKVYSEIGSDIQGFLSKKHIIFYRIRSLDEIEIIRILGAEVDIKNRIKD